MAKPNKEGPASIVQISCAQCKAAIFSYRKGALLKCCIQRIGVDHATTPWGPQFTREKMIRGTPAYKIVGGKVHVK